MRTYIDEYIREKMERGNIMPNPYTPGAGTKPNFLAGRDDTIAQVTSYINETMSGEMARHCIFYGVRGVGKTVLLNKIEEIAEEKDILYSHIECDDHTSLVENIVFKTQRFIEHMSFSEKLKNKFQKIIQMFSLEYDFNDNKAVLNANSNRIIKNVLSEDLTELFVVLGKIAKESGNAICFFIDEIRWFTNYFKSFE